MNWDTWVVERMTEVLDPEDYGIEVVSFQSGVVGEFWRPDWDAMQPKGNPGGYQSFDSTVLHYTAANFGYLVDPQESHDECISQVQSIQRQHQNDPSQTDISYSCLACSHGYLIEGRVLGYKGGANGTGPSNATMPSICALVGVDDVPPPLMLDVIRDFHRRVEARAGHPLDMLGHQQIVSTSCPGDWLMGWVEAEGYRSTQPPIPPPSEEDDMPAPDVVQINEPWGPLPTGAVLICSPDQMHFRWVKSEAELEQHRATFARRGWVFPNPIPPIPGAWLAQYGVFIGPEP